MSIHELLNVFLAYVFVQPFSSAFPAQDRNLGVTLAISDSYFPMPNSGTVWNKIVGPSSESRSKPGIRLIGCEDNNPSWETSGQKFFTHRGKRAPMVNLDELVDFVLSWLDEWEIRELERMFAKHTPSVREMARPLKAERRVDLEKRRRVAEMSPNEMVRELLTSEITGLPNRRAFDEAGAASAVAMSDLDGLKALNDSYGYDAGNALLKAKAAALREAGLEAYHDKGDEFLCRGHTIEELHARLERARGILRRRTIVVERTEGGTLRFRGADFSYGVGKDLDEAEFGLKSHKADREGRGEIARGELRGITIRTVKPEHSPSELSTLQRLPRQPAVKLPRQQTEDTASPPLLR